MCKAAILAVILVAALSTQAAPLPPGRRSSRRTLLLDCPDGSWNPLCWLDGAVDYVTGNVSEHRGAVQCAA